MVVVKFPNITVKLSEVDGNAYAILGKVQSALKQAKVDQSDIDEFLAEATKDSYDHLIQTCMRTVNVE